MTQYTDAAGTISATKTATCIDGPYLRAVPALPVGVNKGNTSLVAAYAAGNGWIYVAATGVITANCPGAEVDDKGVAYNAY
jgi:hypothetical protein